MVEELLSIVVPSAIVGFALGYLLKSYFAHRAIAPSDRHFTARQMKSWFIKLDWATILTRKDREEFALNQLEKIDDNESSSKTEIEKLISEQDELIKQIKELRKRVDSEKGDLITGTLLSQIGHIAAQLSRVRRQFDAHSNDLVTIGKRRIFLRAVHRDETKGAIIDMMDTQGMKDTIADNAGMAMKMLEAEIKALGSAQSIDEAKKAIGSQSN
jgi:seryl-tRNA synthetase